MSGDGIYLPAYIPPSSGSPAPYDLHNARRRMMTETKDALREALEKIHNRSWSAFDKQPTLLRHAEEMWAIADKVLASVPARRKKRKSRSTP